MDSFPKPYNYKYNGKEFQDEMGMNWYSYKWRNYDPALGRFMSIDPLAEKYEDYTPYQFSSNQPVHAKELEGLESSNDLNKKKESAYDRAYNPETSNTDGLKWISYAISDFFEKYNTYKRDTNTKKSNKDLGTTVTSKNGGNENPKTTDKAGENIDGDGFLTATPGAPKSGNKYKNTSNYFEAFNDIIGGMDLGGKTAESSKEVVNDVKKSASQKKEPKAKDSVTVLTFEKGKLIKEERRAKKDYE